MNQHSPAPKSSRSPIGLWLVTLIVLLLAAVSLDVSRRFEADASMDHFLPGEGERELYRVSRKVVESTLTKQMIVTVGYPRGETGKESTEAHVALTTRLKERLSQLNGIAEITSGPPAGLEESFFELYFKRRFSFFSLNPEKEAPLRFSDESLASEASELKNKLSGADGIFLRKLAPQDPWMLFADFLQTLQNDAMALDVRQGQFFARANELSHREDSIHEFSVLFIKLSDSALDSEVQAPLLDDFAGIVSDLHQQHPGAWFVESSGANRFAVDTERSMKSDIQRVLSLSTVGLILLFFALFRSFRRLVFLLLPLASGLILATWLSLLVYGKLHALTLAFGSALIGVAIDYPVHLLSHHELGESQKSPLHTVKELWPTLLLASGTTVVGLLGLAWTAFPGIREIAVFTCTGVVAAVITAMCSVSLLGPSGRAPSLTRKAALLLETGLRRWRTAPRAGVALLIIGTLLTVWGLSQSRFAAGLDSLAPLDGELMAEDNRVRARVGADDGGKLVVSLGSSMEEALIINEAVYRELTLETQKGSLGAFTSVSTLLRSQRLQKKCTQSIKEQPSLAKRTRAALKAEGFVPEAFPDLEEELSLVVPPLKWQELKHTPLKDLLSTLIFRSGEEYAVITALQDIRDEKQLKESIAQVPGAHFFSQKAVLNAAYSDLRQRTAELLLFGLLLVSLSAALRYRNLRRAAAATVPALLAAGATLGVLALTGQELNLLHLLGLLLVCSMGVDYGVFLVDAPEKNVGPALLSITVGCLSTMLSFGALGLSSAPALQALGRSIGLGILLALVFAPTALSLLGDSQKNGKRAPLRS